MLGCRAERERQLREKVRQHAEQVRERRARPADNPADDMRAAQRELEIVSSGRRVLGRSAPLPPNVTSCF